MRVMSTCACVVSLHLFIFIFFFFIVVVACIFRSQAVELSNWPLKRHFEFYIYYAIIIQYHYAVMYYIYLAISNLYLHTSPILYEYVTCTRNRDVLVFCSLTLT